MCRHVVGSIVFNPLQQILKTLSQSICRYFDEPIDDTNEELVKTYCNRMCDVRVSKLQTNFLTSTSPQICKYPEKTKARILKLSSQDEARVNVPQRPMLTGNTNDAKSAFPNRFLGQENKNPSGGMYGAQKRPGTDFAEGSSKKPKVTSVPTFGNLSLVCILRRTQLVNTVTKPFGSTSGLSKPFKPPSFMNKTSGFNRSDPPPPPPVVRPPPITRPSTRELKSPVDVPNTRIPKIRVEEEILTHVETADDERTLVFPSSIHLDRLYFLLLTSSPGIGAP